MIKRVLDIAATSIVLLVFLPVILVVAFLVHLKLGSPVFFRQTRPGLHGKPFEMIKFCSMHDVTDARGNPLPDEGRMTRLGSLLRATSLDELPQLWNVLKGEMHLVGLGPGLFNQQELTVARAARGVFEVRPGLI